MKIALVSTNYQKFSETFIQMQVKELKGDLTFYCEGYLPTCISKDRAKSVEKLPELFWKTSTPEKRLANSFKKNKIQIVLAQYGPSGVAMMEICKELKLPLVVHFHGYDAYRNDVLGSYGKRYHELFQQAAAIIAVSKDMARQLAKLGCLENKIHYIPYGIDTDLFAPGKEKSNATFVSCGRFVEKKGFKYVLKSFAKVVADYPACQLKLIGQGPLEEELRAIVQSERMGNNVTFKGVLTPEEVARELRSSTVYVQHSITPPSNDSEGTPLSVLEALSCGLPVIATKHAGIVDIVQHEKSGFLVNEKDKKEASKRMIELIQYPEISLRMGEVGRDFILSAYKKEHYLEKLNHLLDACLR